MDESGFSLSLHRFYGWATRGKRLVEAVPYGRGKNLSLLGALSRAGMLCTRQKEGAMDRDDVEAFFEDDLLPRLSAGSVLVLDNATIHRGGNLAQLAADAGCSLLYLPPYSPDFNPIEMAWAWMKQRIRHKAPREPEERKQAVQEAIDALPDLFALHWFQKCRLDQCEN